MKTHKSYYLILFLFTIIIGSCGILSTNCEIEVFNYTESNIRLILNTHTDSYLFLYPSESIKVKTELIGYLSYSYELKILGTDNNVISIFSDVVSREEVDSGIKIYITEIDGIISVNSSYEIKK